MKKIFITLMLFLAAPVFAAVELDADRNGATDISRGGTNSTTTSGAKANLGIPSTLSALAGDTTHRVVTDAQIGIWDSKQAALTAGTDYLTPNGSAAGLVNFPASLATDSEVSAAIAGYALPVATTSALGGVKQGDRVEITVDGTISADVQTGNLTLGDNSITMPGPTGGTGYPTVIQAGDVTTPGGIVIRTPTSLPSVGTTRILNIDQYGNTGLVDPATLGGAFDEARNYSPTGTWDFTGATVSGIAGEPGPAYEGAMPVSKVKLPGGTTLPATCEDRELFVDIDAATGQRLYVCENDAWVVYGGAGGGAGVWGAITGTIDNQSDLQAKFTALNNQITTLIAAVEAGGTDVTGPSLTRVAPASQTPTITDDTLALDYTITDTTGVGSATYTINGGTANALSASGSTYTGTVTGFNSGSNSVLISATDSSTAANTSTQTLTVTYSPPVDVCSTGTGAFVGAPGDIEDFEYQAGDFCNTVFSETDTSGHISTYATDYTHSGSHGAWFAGTNAVDDWTTATVKASLAAPEDSYKLEMWVKTPNTTSTYNLRVFYAATNNTSVPSSINTAGALAFKGQGGPMAIVLYNQIGGAGDTSVNLAVSTEYRLVLNMTRASTSTCEIYNTSGTLIDTLVVTLPDRATNYLTWRDFGWAYGLDAVKFDTTNP